MADWLLISIGVAAIVLIIALLVLLRKGWRVSEISLWPPTLKITPPKSNEPVTGADTFLAENKGKLGKVNLEGAAETTSFTARDESEIGDITVKRIRKR